MRIRLQENFALERTYLCGFRQRANTKLLKTKGIYIAVNERMSYKTSSLFQQLSRFEIGRFRSILVPISDLQGRSAFVTVVYKNKVLAKETDR